MDDGKKELAEETRASRSRLEKLIPEKSAHMQPKDMLQPVAEGEKETLRHTGINILGDVRWGTHFCLFYHTKQDLIDILVPYFKAGLENNEFCMWVTSEPLNAQDAKKALKHAVRNLDAYIKKGQIEILDYSDWYTKSGAFEADSVLQGWVQKHDQAIKIGFDGLRLTGNTFWLEKKDWARFTDYEAAINSVIGKYKMLAVCTYSLDKCGASEILDVEHNHQFALIKWRGDWKILESSSKNQLEARLAKQTAIAQALERSKKDWVKTFNAMSDWVALIDLKGRILRTNRAGENFVGKPLDEIIGQSCCKLVHGSDKHTPGCPLRITLHTRQQATTELQVPSTNRWLMVTTDPVIDKKGNLIGAVHVTRDITERKKDEKALQESEKRYRTLFETAGDAILMVKVSADQGARFVDCNSRALDMFGCSREELIGKSPEDFSPPTQPDGIPSHAKVLEIAKATAQGKPQFFEWAHRRLDGTSFLVEVTLNYVDMHDETYMQAHVRNITERKKAVEEIENIAKFPSENPYPVLRIARDGTVLYANEASVALLRDKKSGLGQPAPQRWRQLVEDVLNSGSVERREVEHAGRIFAFRAVPVINAGYVNFYGIDITDRKKAEEALRAANQQLKAANQQLRASQQQLISANQQLRASQQQLRSANQQLRASQQQLLAYQEQLKSLASQLTLTEEHERHRIATDLHATIGQLLVSSKLQLDTLRASAPSGGDLARTLEGVCNLLDEAVQQTRTLVFDLSSPVLYELGFETAVAEWLDEQVQQKHRIKTEFEDDGQPKPLDNDIRVLLFRDVRELLINVVKHAQAGKVKVSVGKVGSQIHVSVEDDGWGFDPKEVAAKGTKKGGFGLFSIRERLEQLGGHIEIKSAPGHGCRVAMMAPLKEENITNGG